MHQSARRIARGLRRLAVVPVSILAVLTMSSVASANVPVNDGEPRPVHQHRRESLAPDRGRAGHVRLGQHHRLRVPDRPLPDGGSDDIGLATSTDAGATWTPRLHAGHHRLRRPARAVRAHQRPLDRLRPQARRVAGHFSLTVDTKNTDLVNRSTDGGLTWANPVVVSTPTGERTTTRPGSACDTWSKSPNYGNCYAEVDDYVARRHDEDVHLHRRREELDARPGRRRRTAWAASRSRSRTAPSSSRSWPTPARSSRSFRPTAARPTRVPTRSPASSTTASPAVRTEPLPSAEVDKKGNVYVVWQDCPFAPAARSTTSS